MVENGKPSINFTEVLRIHRSETSNFANTNEMNGINEVSKTNMPIYIMNMALGIATRFVIKNRLGN